MNIREHIERERQEEAERLRILEAGLPMDPWMAADFAVDCGLSDRLPSILYRTWQRGGIEDLQPALWAVWVHNKSPRACLGERKWLELFKAAGFTVVTSTTVGEDTKFGQLTERPSEPLELWRGAAVATNGRGFSWSVHRECAVEFAEGVAGVGFDAALFRAVVPPRAMLALFGDWREQEVVVNPNMLRGRVSVAERLPANLTIFANRFANKP